MIKEIFTIAWKFVWASLWRFVVLFAVGLLLNVPIGLFFTFSFAESFGLNVGPAARTSIGAVFALVANSHVIAFALLYLIAVPLAWAHGAILLAAKASLKNVLISNASMFSGHIARACVALEKSAPIQNAQQKATKIKFIRNSLLNDPDIGKSHWVIRIMVKLLFRGEQFASFYQRINDFLKERPLAESELLPYYESQSTQFIQNLEFKGTWSYVGKMFVLNVILHLVVFGLLFVVPNLVR